MKGICKRKAISHGVGVVTAPYHPVSEVPMTPVHISNSRMAMAVVRRVCPTNVLYLPNIESLLRIARIQTKMNPDHLKRKMGM